MYFEGIKTTTDAKDEGLVPITVWLLQNEMKWLEKELKRIGSNESRKAMLVKRNGSFALFVNDVTGRFGSYDESKDIDIDD